MEKAFFKLIRDLNLDAETESKVLQIFSMIIEDFNSRFVLLELTISAFHHKAFRLRFARRLRSAFAIIDKLLDKID